MIRSLALLLLTFAACVRAQPDTLRTSVGQEGYFPGADNMRLFYRTVGAGSDTVVVVHGQQGNTLEYLAPDLEPLADGRTLLFYTQRGGGRSDPVEDPEQLGLEAHVRDLEALRQHFGLECLTLLGHSGGAGIAMRYAIEHPSRVERMLLLAPMPPASVPFGPAAGQAFMARFEPGVAKAPVELQEALNTTGSSAERAERTSAAFMRALSLTGELHRAGVPLVLGTDLAVPGHTIHRELELAVEAGLSPMEALLAATSVPARAMGMDVEVGTVEVGKRADLLLVIGNPLEDMRAIRNVSLVIADGRGFAPAPLWGSVGFQP